MTMHMTARICAGLGLLLWMMGAGAYEVPFPKTSYEALGRASELLVQPAATLFILMDETTQLNENKKVHRAVQELAVDWLGPGRAVQVIRFSAYVPGRNAEIVTGGLLDPEPSKSFIKSMKRSERRKFARLHKKQVHAAKVQTTKAIRAVFRGFSAEIPKSEILFNMEQLSDHIRSYQSTEKVILLVSDMLENSAATSFYASGRVRKINPEAELKKAEKKNLVGDFGGNVRVYIVGLGAGAEDYLDGDRVNRLKTFWRDYFKAAKATVAGFGTPLLLGGLE